MTAALYAQLAVLALIDSTSIGTLLIPLWLALRPEARRLAPRIVLYLGVLGVFYLLVGIAMLNGAHWVAGGLGGTSLTRMPAVQWLMAIAGGAMLAYALVAKPTDRQAPKSAAKAAAPVPVPGAAVPGTAGTSGAGAVPAAGKGAAPAGATEIKWKKRVSAALRSPGGIVGLALLAGLLELPTMIPYLVAIGFLTNSTLPLGGGIAVLAVYCLVMLLPALLILGLRVLLGARLDPLLQKISVKMAGFAGETLLWVLGIAGFLLLRLGLSALAPMAAWNPFK